MNSTTDQRTLDPSAVHDAARLLHSALELSTHQLAMSAKAADAASHRIVSEHRSLLVLTKEIAGRSDS